MLLTVLAEIFQRVQPPPPPPQNYFEVYDDNKVPGDGPLQANYFGADIEAVSLTDIFSDLV